MQAHRPKLYLPILIAVAAILLGFVVIHSAGEGSVDNVPANNFTATRTHSGLSLTMPYHTEHAGRGRLEVEILDPENEVLGKAERDVDVAVGDGMWRQEVSPIKPIAFDDLVWERVRYRFTYNGEASAAMEETRAVSEILRRPMVRVLGQTTYLAGGQAAIRLVVTDANGNALTGTSTVRVELLVPDHQPQPLFSGRVNQRGTVEAQFRVPAGLAGSYQLHIVADTPLGITETQQPVKVEDKVSILLTTEKPIYQPGQTIHVRALALDRADHHAAAGKLTFEVEDSRGNKVFKKATATDEYGIASAEFTLADEVNLGTYHLRALMGNADAPTNMAEIALNVQRYVLPKFKVAVDFTAKDGKPRRDYRPGEHVTGTVHANYFFGKALESGEVDVKASSADVSINDAGESTGKTDNDGEFHFDIKLPAYFAGRLQNGGAAPVLIEATVKDNAGHSETRDEPVTVSPTALLVTAIPEGGALIPNLQNQVYVLASYADGTPAEASVRVHEQGVADQTVSTDNSGVAVVRMTPTPGQDALQMEAADQHGNRVTATVSLDARAGEDQVLVRTDRAVYKAGDRILLNILATQAQGAAYVDVVKDGQTLITRDVDINHGRAELTVPATPDMAGALDIHVYKFGRDSQIIGDHRLVFVQPADELRIDATADAPVYKPGAEARIKFRITDSHGQGVHAALGLQIVDEAVFALAEKQPGFAKVFFYLEQELMKPRYEIHSLSMSDVVEPVAQNEEHQRDVRALFAATETVNPNKMDVEFGRELPQGKQFAYTQRYRVSFNDQAAALTERMNSSIKQGQKVQSLPDVFAALLKSEGSKDYDAWGTPLRLQPVSWMHRGSMRYYTIQSAGPDRKFDTPDDMSQNIEARTGVVTMPGSGAGLTVKLEHDRGADNGQAEITGTVTDMSGAAIPQAIVTLRAISVPQALGDAKSRKAVTNASGDFTLAGLPPGDYQVTISSAGFELATKKLSLQARDLAIVRGTLQVGAVTETVEVAADAMGGPLEARARGFAMFEAGVAARATIPAPQPQMMLHMAAAESVNSALQQAPAGEPTHVRSYFPEALYINPEIITDASGSASITVPMADSITTWRMAMLASTKNGALGTGTSSLKVFQDFFVDLDLPVTLTQGDRVSVPVAIYNYAGERGDVKLKLQPEDWYSLVDDSAQKSVPVNAGQVGGAQFTLEAKRIGKFKLTLSARLDGKAARQDIVVREIEVVPNGKEENIVFNGRLDAPRQTNVESNVHFPADAVPDASKLFIRLYPGPLSQVIEGMDSLLRMPYGCFEQTSSSTYPNVLALDYMKRTKKLTPEVHAKAEGFIATGYQRLLTFEVPGGGFSWFGQAPANKILTAYGLMEFSDMAKVHDVDPRLIARTRDWLIAQQQEDGSWKPDTSFINEGATNRYNSDLLRITAYIAWALENTGYQGLALEKAKHFVEAHLNGNMDAYTLAVVANFAVDYGKDQGFAQTAIQKLLDARKEEGEMVWWNSEETGVYSTGNSAAVETTGLAVQALLKWKQENAVARKALSWLMSKKQASGDWGTTQATIMALRALLLASESSGADVRGTVNVTVNGKPVETLQLTTENNDLFHQIVLPATSDANNVHIRFEGTGGLAYQVVGRYFMPWDSKPETEALAIDVKYDRTQLAQNDIVTATATVRNNLQKTANMVMVDLGVPPGFELLSEDLQDYQEKSAGKPAGRLEKFSLTATQAILYFNAFAPRSTVELRFRLRAKYPIRAKTFESKVYEYYDPAVNAVSRPVQLEVRAR